MKRMHQPLMLLAMALCLLIAPAMQTVQAEEIDTSNPFKLLEQVSERMTKRIAEERETIEANPNYLREIMAQELLPYSDYQFAARAVMARNWGRLNEQQQNDFVAAFRDYLVTTYARVFTQYDENKHRIVFAPAGNFENERRVTVRAQLIEEGGRPPIRIEFQMQRRNPQAPWMAFDLVAEGVSMLNAQRSEMEASLRQNGIEGTIQLLRDRAAVEIDLNEDLDVSDFTS
ncbi:MlaC/ttg2D family ABC transporter substrate-binding protein [Aliidiomarina haloalkalitolerans]|uniref:Organic solvent ABC transporter n=1 Tax=Aliidiomarina haloalkalitolerans TaxID=859059 RepID=A0A432VUS0_9GAMM|nr:ABC transporter substrate-binding protein [Aliidiomarina haloalkalitolerans]RUO20273.1 organic solvent ABC transporter [Aliidiomarina haloalkalitolerans]